VIYQYVPGLGYQWLPETEHIEPGKGYWILYRDVSISEQGGIKVKVEYP
jgi:hypothetical protein